MVSKKHKIHISRNYYQNHKKLISQKRKLDRHFKNISKEMTHIMSYQDMLETLRYIKKTYY